jgi:cytochrome c551/c552
LGTPDDPANKKKASAVPVKAITYEQVNLYNKKHLCACHNPEKKQVGPAFREIARRNYSVDKIVSLIYNPQPQNGLVMLQKCHRMPQVPKDQQGKLQVG